MDANKRFRRPAEASRAIGPQRGLARPNSSSVNTQRARCHNRISRRTKVNFVAAQKRLKGATGSEKERKTFRTIINSRSPAKRSN